MKNFSKYIIKDYKYWSISVHFKPSYLGQCVVWCKRENALDLADATNEEQKELFAILKELKRVAKKSFQPDWFNYAFLGNETRHLHGHFVPRYSSPRRFKGVTFTDDRWGLIYQPYRNLVISPRVVEAIRLKLKKGLRG